MELTALLVLLLVGSGATGALRRWVMRVRRSRSRPILIASTWGSLPPDEGWDHGSDPGAATVADAPVRTDGSPHAARESGASATSPPRARSRRRRHRRNAPLKSRKLLALLGYTLAGLLVTGVVTAVLRPSEPVSAPPARTEAGAQLPFATLQSPAEQDRADAAQAEIAAERRRARREDRAAKRREKARRKQRAAKARDAKQRIVAGREQGQAGGGSQAAQPAAPAEVTPPPPSPTPPPATPTPSQPPSPPPSQPSPPPSEPPSPPTSAPPVCDFPPC